MVLLLRIKQIKVIRVEMEILIQMEEVIVILMEVEMDILIQMEEEMEIEIE